MSITNTISNGVMTIEIARPEKKNAFTQAMYQAMAEAVEAAMDDHAVRSLLIAGQPGVFTSGNDLEDFLQRPPGGEDSPALHFMQALRTCDKPVVAAVTGVAIGIGVTMLLHCDLVYVSDDARLAMPFVALGLVPEFGSSLLVPQLMGRARAAQMLLLGDPFSAADAVELGIATAMLPAGEVLLHARRVAERFNALPPEAVRETKRLMRSGSSEAVRRAIQEEVAIFTTRLRSPEAREALGAFLARRKPDFGRS